MAKTAPLESNLNEIFGKNAPELPANGKKAIVDAAPWIALVVGILTLFLAWGLYNTARLVDNLVTEASYLCSGPNLAYGSSQACGTMGASHLNFWVWLGIAVLVAEGVLYLLAYPGLQDRKKVGWNYLYYGALLNVVYAIVSLLNSNGRIGHFIGALIGSAIGFWILFQIRSAYLPSVTDKEASKNK